MSAVIAATVRLSRGHQRPGLHGAGAVLYRTKMRDRGIDGYWLARMRARPTIAAAHRVADRMIAVMAEETVVARTGEIGNVAVIVVGRMAVARVMMVVSDIGRAAVGHRADRNRSCQAVETCRHWRVVIISHWLGGGGDIVSVI